MSITMTKKPSRQRREREASGSRAHHGVQAIHPGEVTFHVSQAIHQAGRLVWILLAVGLALTVASLAFGSDNAAVGFLSVSSVALGAKLGIGRP